MLVKPTLRSWKLALVAVCIVLGTAYLSAGNDLFFNLRNGLASKSVTGPGAGNDTLGFGAIYVLTEDASSWRVQGLRKAARLVGLRITIPIQRQVSHEGLLSQVSGQVVEGYGRSRALVNHLALLDTIAQAPYETVLVLEDDVDFGLDIRAQMELVSKAFWDRAGGAPEFRDPEQEALHPYRHHEWDIFWPGHFGMSFIDGTEIYKYHDPHALPWSRLKTQFNNYYEQMAASNPPEPQQLIFNVAPLSTYAYAITKSHAARLVQKIRNDKADSFDTALHIDCVGKAHRCVAPVPQLFHHHRVTGGKVSSGKEASAGNDGAVQNMVWYRKKHKYTYNIEWSARCNAIGAGEKVGERWQCLPGQGDGEI
ncbi:hypothetical protein CB0940_11015 [Cercospora beticola]|uniref:Procollagen galactosyltransferase 1 n=1 Tax=Cercospora beticola TaxID=122368 RepID=A0A2G5HE95_CERBT|nr:hypothetical protein CB0940_11015 [Cercospora beticola]PIA90838.1 hypothetical protein CB0940_11015 [Cercospora beticola]WPB07841.1 hypothetical protein RHO25_012505 [Cercospora beticola]CAK1368323.1 unnamed protein product [Cercospora beticola]